jgi:hypothetical protein
VLITIRILAGVTFIFSGIAHSSELSIQTYFRSTAPFTCVNSFTSESGGTNISFRENYIKSFERLVYERYIQAKTLSFDQLEMRLKKLSRIRQSEVVDFNVAKGTPNAATLRLIFGKDADGGNRILPIEISNRELAKKVAVQFPRSEFFWTELGLATGSGTAGHLNLKYAVEKSLVYARLRAVQFGFDPEKVVLIGDVNIEFNANYFKRFFGFKELGFSKLVYPYEVALGKLATLKGELLREDEWKKIQERYDQIYFADHSSGRDTTILYLKDHESALYWSKHFSELKNVSTEALTYPLVYIDDVEGSFESVATQQLISIVRKKFGSDMKLVIGLVGDEEKMEKLGNHAILRNLNVVFWELSNSLKAPLASSQGNKSPEAVKWKISKPDPIYVFDE